MILFVCCLILLIVSLFICFYHFSDLLIEAEKSKIERISNQIKLAQSKKERLLIQNIVNRFF